jgi:ribulose-5-phosphate 4-epimerase/fuculose-1-phosphate aldolase
MLTETPEQKMGRIEQALAQLTPFPKAMPGLPRELTIQEKMACSARILAFEGCTLNVAGHITVVQEDSTDLWVNGYGTWWEELSASDICVIDEDGDVKAGRWDVTPAVAIHTELHRSRPDAKVVIHNHPYYATLLATMHVLPEITDQQACMFDDEVVLFDEYTGGVDNADAGRYLAKAIGPDASVAVLANHGIIVMGSSVEEATYKLTTFERTCKLNYHAMLAGKTAVPVPKEQRQQLKPMLLNDRLTVRYYWDGAVRQLLRRAPEVLD